MAKKTVDFDINEVFEGTKKSLEASIFSAQSKIELLDNLAKYFKDNGLRVVKDEVVETEADAPISNN